LDVAPYFRVASNASSIARRCGEDDDLSLWLLIMSSPFSNNLVIKHLSPTIDLDVFPMTNPWQ
jgi:hypothetical protein